MQLSRFSQACAVVSTVFLALSLSSCSISSRLGIGNESNAVLPVVVVDSPREGLSILARGPNEPLLIESVAFDARGRLLVAAIHGEGVYRLGLDGSLERFSREGATQGVFGMVADRQRGHLWITTSNTVWDTLEGDIGTALVRLNLNSGEVEATYSIPEPGHLFSDLTLGPDGSVFVSDDPGRAILMLAPGAGRLTKLVELTGGASAQGLVVSDNGRWLIYADYVSGLQRVVISTGAQQPVWLDASIEARGLDGLAVAGHRLVAIQNGTANPRVLELTLSPDWTRVRNARILVEGADLSEPTTGFIDDNSYIFVARSQWTDFGRDGTPQTETPDPPTIGRITL